MYPRTFLSPLFILLLAITFIACGKPVQEGDLRSLKMECLSAVDERCYAEMMEYMVLKDQKKLDALRAAGKVVVLPAGRKVKILKRKIDMALVAYTTRQGKKQVWIAVKYLQ